MFVQNDWDEDNDNRTNQIDEKFEMKKRKTKIISSMLYITQIIILWGMSWLYRLFYRYITKIKKNVIQKHKTKNRSKQNRMF